MVIEKKIIYETITEYQCKNCNKFFNDPELLDREKLINELEKMVIQKVKRMMTVHNLIDLKKPSNNQLDSAIVLTIERLQEEFSRERAKTLQN